MSDMTTAANSTADGVTMADIAAKQRMDAAGPVVWRFRCNARGRRIFLDYAETHRVTMPYLGIPIEIDDELEAQRESRLVADFTDGSSRSIMPRPFGPPAPD